MKKNGKPIEENKALVAFGGENLPEGITQEEWSAIMKADLEKTMEGVIPRLPQIKILHAGALTFKFPDESKQDEFEGIIVDQHPCNAFWEKDYSESGGGIPPTCSSLNGIDGTVYGKCGKCEHNKFGTGKDGLGKACKNMKRLHILIGGDKLPFRLTLPPTSIATADEFFTSLFSKGFPLMSQVVKFSLNKAESAGGIEYSEIHLQAERQVDVNLYIELRRMVGTYLNQIRGQAVEAEEYFTEDKNGKPAFEADESEMAEPNPDNVPF